MLLRWNNAESRFEKTDNRYQDEAIDIHDDYFHVFASHANSYDGPGSPMGTGRTIAEAIEDLLIQLHEAAMPN